MVRVVKKSSVQKKIVVCKIVVCKKIIIIKIIVNKVLVMLKLVINVEFKFKFQEKVVVQVQKKVDQVSIKLE